MSARSLRARLDRLGTAPPGASARECRHHGTVCGMGADWPQPYTHDLEDDFTEMVINAHRACGRETELTRRERWEIHTHELVPAAEIEQRAREVAELVAELQAKNAVIEAELRGERHAELRGEVQ